MGCAVFCRFVQRKGVITVKGARTFCIVCSEVLKRNAAVRRRNSLSEVLHVCALLVSLAVYHLRGSPNFHGDEIIPCVGLVIQYFDSTGVPFRSAVLKAVLGFSVTMAA